jgi:hypothetical protein
VIVIDAGAAEIAFTDEEGWTGGSVSTFTFTGVAFGPDTGDRFVCVALLSAPGFTTSATIGGVSATEYRLPGTGSETSIRFYVAAPSGTSGDVVVTRSGATSVMHIAAWAISGADSATPVDYVTAYDAAPPTALTLAVEDGGVVLALAQGSGSSSPASGVDADFAVLYVSFYIDGGASAITADDAAYALSTSTHSYLGAISFR